MVKIGGGFWPFWARKRAVFDSGVSHSVNNGDEYNFEKKRKNKM